ncbi:hypothetical protein N8576_01715, partial [bacterium]|nr:hypothetical protein [bacterium]
LKAYRKAMLARVPASIPPPKPTKKDAEIWKDRYFKKHPSADADQDGKLTWPELQAHKKSQLKK